MVNSEKFNKSKKSPTIHKVIICIITYDFFKILAKFTLEHNINLINNCDTSDGYYKLCNNFFYKTYHHIA